ncbi:MAG: hypothetical protein WAP03_02365 [Methylorubrum rhodinum]|uniref:hypothetical protein n=1 Tax=Methylorubrum rhodinum TaxID=29428 RepID=UPI003BB1CC22
MSQVHNEQTKLLATGLNNVSVACIVIGVVTPISAMSFGVASAPPLSFRAGAFAVIWLMAGGCLHWCARHALRRLKP